MNGTGEKADAGTVANGAEATGDCVAVQAYSNPYGDAPVLNITGGTLKSANAKPVAEYKVDENEAAPSITVSGGTFSSSGNASDMSAYYPDNGVEYIQDDAGKLYDASTIAVEYKNNQGKVSYSASIPSAFSNGTYKLLKDITRTSRMTPGILGSDVTLDLNSHTLTSTASDTNPESTT